MCSVSWLFLLGCQYQCKWLTGKTHLWNDPQYVDGDVKPYSLTYSLTGHCRSGCREAVRSACKSCNLAISNGFPVKTSVTLCDGDATYYYWKTSGLKIIDYVVQRLGRAHQGSKVVLYWCTGIILDRCPSCQWLIWVSVGVECRFAGCESVTLTVSVRGTGIRGLLRGMATVPQGNQELLVVRDKVGRPSGELGVSKSIGCDIFTFDALTLLVGWQEGHPACKKLGVGLLVVMIWLELCTSYSSNCHHSAPPSSLAPIKSRMETFWYRFVWVVVENGRQCDFPFSVVTPFGNRKSIGHVKTWLLAVTIPLELCTSFSSSCRHHVRHPSLQ